jgi:hypothetical protein
MARKIINTYKLLATVMNTKKESMVYKNNIKKKRVEKLQ